MSTSSITPDPSSLTSAVTGPTPSNYVEQSSQNPPPAPEDVSNPVNGASRLNSVLARVVGLPTPINASTPSPGSGGVASTNDDADGTSSGQRPGWKSALGKVASIVSTGLAGVPAGGRPSFLGGLGQGSRAAIAAQAAAQDLKFRDFDSSVKAAELHNQDLHQQNASQAASDAHEDHLEKVSQFEDDHDWGLDGDDIANHGAAAITHGQNQTAANGSVAISPMSRVSDDKVSLPHDTQSNNDKTLAEMRYAGGLFGITVPDGATKAPTNQARAFNNMLQGYKADGSQYNHDELPGVIASDQAKIAQLQKAGTSADNLGIMQSVLKYHQTLLDGLDKHAAGVAGNNEQAKEQGKIAAQNSPEGQALLARQNAGKAALQDNAAGNKAANTNPTWVSGVSADEKKKAELAENIAFNANAVASTIMKRPDLLGAVAGRFTNTQQMIGNNDPDISALGVHIHNMAMANSGVHGFRSQEGVESYEKQLLNNFKNGPAAMAGALNASTGSVQTFIDNARPEAYKTHTKQGGAVRGMMGVQQ